MRYIYLHPRAMPDDEIDANVAEIRRLLANPAAEVTSGRDDFQKRARSLGGWAAWERSVGAGTRSDGSPEFGALIASDFTVGKATAAILQAALAHNRPIAVFRGGEFKRISKIVARDPKDWKNGWDLVA